ncbi:SDR family oxidoreductase [Ectobacillus sp. JY-23]|uniref:SDR family NAD(P)-dependent oxidoreductase n=1 Tax=Ectobacillus sp. JY-23 TaxID=2933872 RepID=UPI001FF68B4F|nr:SDR family oxidoreductase [Ectobacillus sp. JY-23]UOY93905.1 SDR family oxidoreductase [Ectobacillus sp. JY-23]
MELKGKIAAITGASGGIGEQLARLLVTEGATVVLLARREEELMRVRQEIGSACYVYRLDVSDEKMVADVFTRISQEVGDVDILVNNAGFGIFKTFEEASLQEVKAMFDVNVFGLVACTKAVLPAMKKRSSGHIVNIASLAGKIATPKSSAYSATKHAVLAFSNSLRMELATSGVSVTSVNPGPIRTDFFNIADESGTYVKSVERYMLRPEYVAACIVKAIKMNKREINLPRWMSAGPLMFALLPRVFEKWAGTALNKK